MFVTIMTLAAVLFLIGIYLCGDALADMKAIREKMVR